MKIGLIIQARISSTRLPGKVMMELPYGSGITVLEQVINRVKASEEIDAIIIATTNNKEDAPIVNIAKRKNVKWFRGDDEDVLSRYYLAAKKNNIDVVVRITSDCPCADAVLMDKIIRTHLRGRYDYTTNSVKNTFPRGLDVEVISFPALEKAHMNAKQNFEREHVTPYIYKSHPEKFRIKIVTAKGRLKRPGIRVTLDTKEDYVLLCCIYGYLYPKNRLFSAGDMLKLFDRKPWLAGINKKSTQKKLADS